MQSLWHKSAMIFYAASISLRKSFKARMRGWQETVVGGTYYDRFVWIEQKFSLIATSCFFYSLFKQTIQTWQYENYIIQSNPFIMIGFRVSSSHLPLQKAKNCIKGACNNRKIWLHNNMFSTTCLLAVQGTELERDTPWVNRLAVEFPTNKQTECLSLFWKSRRN